MGRRGLRKEVKEMRGTTEMGEGGRNGRKEKEGDE